MVIVRATADVLNTLRRGGTRIASDPAASTSALGDWHAKVVRTRRGTWVLAIAEKTCLPIGGVDDSWRTTQQLDLES